MEKKGPLLFARCWLVAETGGASQKNLISDKRQGEIFSVLESTLR